MGKVDINETKKNALLQTHDLFRDMALQRRLSRYRFRCFAGTFFTMLIAQAAPPCTVDQKF